MTTITAIAAAWLAISLPLGILIGRTIRHADQADTCPCCDNDTKVTA